VPCSDASANKTGAGSRCPRTRIRLPLQRCRNVRLTLLRTGLEQGVLPGAGGSHSSGGRTTPVVRTVKFQEIPGCCRRDPGNSHPPICQPARPPSSKADREPCWRDTAGWNTSSSAPPRSEVVRLVASASRRRRPAMAGCVGVRTRRKDIPRAPTVAERSRPGGRARRV